MHLQTVLGHLKTLADRVLLHEERLVELPRKENRRWVCNRVALLDTDHMIDASVMENFSRELTMTRGNEDEF